jgi:hypothetical protein
LPNWPERDWLGEQTPPVHQVKALRECQACNFHQQDVRSSAVAKQQQDYHEDRVRQLANNVEHSNQFDFQGDEEDRSGNSKRRKEKKQGR